MKIDAAGEKALLGQLVQLKYARAPVKEITSKLSINVNTYKQLVDSDAFKDAYDLFLRQVQRDAVAICRQQAREIAEEAMKQLMSKVKEGNIEALKIAFRDVIQLAQPEAKGGDTSITIQLPAGLDVKDVPNDPS